jgi:hypothetical protein
MPTLILSNEQVVELVKQLSVEQQVEVFRFLLLRYHEKSKPVVTFLRSYEQFARN